METVVKPDCPLQRYAYSWLVQTARVLLMVLYTAALYSGHSMLALAVLCAAQYFCRDAAFVCDGSIAIHRVR